MKRLKEYASFLKIEHTLFSVPLLFAGALLAGKNWPSVRVTLLIVLAAAGARIVALALNRIFDRKFDRMNPRTKSRHLASGRMKLPEAWLLTAAGLFLYLGATALISSFCLKLSWIPIVVFAAYPFFKRFTKWTHLGLGIVWSLVPFAGFFAMNASLEGIWPVVPLGLFSIFWLAGFDIIYAVQDENFDRKAGLYSLPSAWGSRKAMIVSGVFHFLAFLSLILLYSFWFSGPLTIMVLMIVGLLLLLEQAFSRYIDFAFLHVNIAVGFAVLVFVISGLKGV